MSTVIALSQTEQYRVIDRKEGGMGRIYILQRLSKQPIPSLYSSRRMQDEFKFVYRDRLAAKAIKTVELEGQFLRELNIWITLTPRGIAPLLKVIRVGEELLGIMPAYDGNLRERMPSSLEHRARCLRYLKQAVQGLDAVSKSGILHLDLKPENLLVTTTDNQFQIDVADWGLANIKKELARSKNLPQSEIATIVGTGTVPYMSPERFGWLKPDIRSDVFSLGVIFYELLVGELPYHPYEPFELQICSGNYIDRVQQMVSKRRLPPLVANMLQPDIGKRTSSYDEILRFLDSL